MFHPKVWARPEGPTKAHTFGPRSKASERALPKGRRPEGWASERPKPSAERKLGEGVGRRPTTERQGSVGPKAQVEPRSWAFGALKSEHEQAKLANESGQAPKAQHKGRVSKPKVRSSKGRRPEELMPEGLANESPPDISD